MKFLRSIVFALLLTGLCILAPAQTAPPPAAPQLKVLVMPFVSIDQGEHLQWVGRAVQQSLVADLARQANIQAIAAAQPTMAEVTDPAAAANAAKSQQAQFIIMGSYQAVDDSNLRLTGQ